MHFRRIVARGQSHFNRDDYDSNDQIDVIFTLLHSFPPFKFEELYEAREEVMVGVKCELLKFVHWVFILTISQNASRMLALEEKSCEVL